MHDANPSDRSPAHPDEGPVERYGRWVALGLVGVALVLRARGLGEYWLNPDEGIYYSTLTWSSFDAFWGEVRANAHPPGFYLLLRTLAYVTWDFVWLRGAALAFGVASVWVFWLLGRELGGGGARGVATGLTAAGLVAVNPNAIVLSQVMRPYTLLVLLLAGGVLSFLRARGTASRRALAVYAACFSLAALTHYSAALALAVVSLLLGADAVGALRLGDAGRDRRRAVTLVTAAHAVPCVVVAALVLLHARRALGSDLMDDALRPGGWLSGWLVDSPRDAWYSFVAFQDFHVPAALRVPSALVCAAAIAWAAMRDRPVFLLAAGALGVAVAASALDVYPFGESRHNAWLAVFTLPALAWLVGGWITAPPRRVALGAAALVLLGAVSAALGGVLSPPERPTVAVESSGGIDRPVERATSAPLEEQLIRREDIAPLIVRTMDPGSGPRLVVMTDQSYNVLMPLYAAEKEELRLSPDGSFFHFAYGARTVAVARTWDWASMADLGARLEGITTSLGGGGDPVLLLAGGWGSTVLAEFARLGREGVATDGALALAYDPDGTELVRMVAIVIDPAALSGR